MDILLTSFGLNHNDINMNRYDDIFERMVPFRICEATDDLLPDYSVLIMGDRLVIDHQSFDNLQAHGRTNNLSKIAETFHALNQEGFLRIVDYSSVIESKIDLLREMTNNDLKILDHWVPALKESLGTWKAFNEYAHSVFDKGLEAGIIKDTSKGFYRNWTTGSRSMPYMHWASARLSWLDLDYFDAGIKSSTKRRQKKYRDQIKGVLGSYLSYVNLNLVLSQEYSCAIHDWNDFHPFYRQKFQVIGREEPPMQRETSCSRKLLDIVFPELTFIEPKKLIGILNDDRLTELRKIIRSCANGECEFDAEFSNRVLREVINTEKIIEKYRKITSYATIPLGMIPVLGMPIEKATGMYAEKKISEMQQKKLEWYYLISEAI